MPCFNLQAWESELENDIDKNFLLHIINSGFNINDDDAHITPIKCSNHSSARPGSPLYEKASAQVRNETEAGNYVICDSQPAIVSPMAAIPKSDGDVRLIHNCSRPVGKAVNDHCTSDWHQKFSRVDDAASLMMHRCYFAKVDLRSAYRSVRISKESQKVTGFKWNFGGETVYLKATKLPFGAKLSPGIFHRLTQVVKRIMARKGYNLLVVYLDDFLISAESKIQCAEALNCLVQLLRKLGFAIHWGKVVDPTTKITFLGIELDSLEMTLRLPEAKFQNFHDELHSFLQLKGATKRQFQSLAGQLSWAAGVVRGGRVFLRHIFNKISSLQHASHRALISSEIHEDLLWWFNFLRTFNGHSVLLDKQPTECVFTDACNEAAGGSFGLDWFYLNWNQDLPVAESFHINEKEVLAVVLATQQWASYWQNKHVTRACQ